MKKDLDYIAKLERAIAQKYGKEAVQNPKGNWDEEKEKEYLEQLKKLYEREIKKSHHSEKIEVEGFLVPRKLINKDTKRNCPVCEEYSFSRNDDVYMSKFECCFNCYIEYVEDREERWASGWRPNLGDNKCQKKT